MKPLYRCALTVLLLLPAVGCSAQPVAPVVGDVELAEDFLEIIETLAAEEMEGRDAGTAGVELARYYLIGRFQAAGLEPGFVIDGEPSFSQSFEITTGADAEGQPIKVVTQNVGGLVPGVGPFADQIIVVGGHYDHVGYGYYGSRSRASGTIHPGADDNASGTAGVVLLAEQWAAYVEANPDTPRRTVFFTGFAGEERGLLGSRYMVSKPEEWPFELDALAGMINMDMIGRLSNNELYLFGDKTGEQWRAWTVQANQELGLGLELQLDVPAPGGSDHSMFIAVGCPSIFFNTWLHDDYHTPNDTAEKINASGGAVVVTLVGALLQKAATTDERLVYVAPPPPAPRPVLGVQIDRGGEGVRVTAVVEGGPAAQAGLAVGDLILSLDEAELSSPGELRREIRRHEPGDEVTLVIMRGEAKMELKVTLGRR
ncbi:MAG: M20/M25/M40 family metallo-hydrolase [Planctomycetota bacterium]